MKETKAERFHRLAEARVNKIIKMIRLLGNCSNQNIYEFRTDQIAQIFQALQREISTAHMRFLNLSSPQRKRFSLTASESSDTKEEMQPFLEFYLPDGSTLRATAYPDTDYPCINLYQIDQQGEKEEICFAEYNPEKPVGHRLYIGAYQSHLDDTVYYQPYVAERD